PHAPLPTVIHTPQSINSSRSSWHFFSTPPRPTISPLFPYTTLFRSRDPRARGGPRVHCAGRGPDHTPPGVLSPGHRRRPAQWTRDRKSTRLNSSHVAISYAGLCLKKKNHS